MKKLWFKAKHYGWGWYPCSWEGWLILLVWFAIFMTSIRMLEQEWLKNLIVVSIITIILIWVCYKKGEKPCWRWG